MSTILQTHSYTVRCPLYGKNEKVYIHTIDLGSTHAAQFNGCDSSFHKCSECEQCAGITLARFSSEHPEQQYMLLR